MQTARVEIPLKLIPVFDGPADVRGAHGGRGSAKTRSFAKMAAVKGYMFGNQGVRGQILCARQYMNSLDDSSLEECKRAIEDEPWLAAYYDVGEKYIKSRDGRIDFTFAGLDRNIDSIKSKGRILLCWVDEAEPVSESAWNILIPTLREEGDGWNAELWVTWNRKRKNAAVERFTRSTDSLIKIAELNWRDNPKFPATLERNRLRDQRERPDQYPHIWEGEFASVIAGAYYASSLTQAKAERRIGRVSADPLMTIRLFIDIGGTGARADAFAMWASQFIGKEIRALNYYEQVGQPLATHLAWMRENGYTPDKAQVWLPHDGATHDKVYAVSYESALREAGYSVTVVPNQGAGAAKARIEAGRRLFPSIWFDEEKTSAGRDALGWYHEKKDDKRDIGLGPEHDWASHGCFHGSTKVLTRYGICQIMNLPFTGEVLTPCGWKQYIFPRITKRAAPLVEVVFTSGYSVRCTPDHLFLTDGGWKSAESLTPNTAIQSTLTNSLSISMVGFIGFGLANRIYRAVAKRFTGMLGVVHLGLSRMVATSTIEMETCSTTGLKTWSAWRLANISQNHEASDQSPIADGLRRQQDKKPLIGTLRQKAGYGISATPKEQRAGPNGHVKRSLASTVVSHFRRLLGRAATPGSIARWPAKWPRIEREARQTNTPLRIESVKRLSEKADVWDITVPAGHWFSLENGAVVHNSDAFGLMCVAHEEQTVQRNKPRQAVSWLG